MGVKQRLDVLLVMRGLASSRAKAQALIRAGEVQVAGQVFDKPGMDVSVDAAIDVRSPPAYVGRGGLKLAAALDSFAVEPHGRTCLDVGASTGGFTDALLQRGARHVYAVDVGRGQLAWSLRQDPRVTCLERTDIRTLEALPERPSLAVVDVAFISLRQVLPAAAHLLHPSGEIIALIKPQFEAGREAVGRGGIVRDATVHRRVVREVLAWAHARGWRLADARPSPVTGAGGNREFFVHVGLPGSYVSSVDLDDLVDLALVQRGGSNPPFSPAVGALY